MGEAALPEKKISLAPKFPSRHGAAGVREQIRFAGGEEPA